MCSRYLLLEKHYHALLQRLGVPAPVNFPTRYNIAPNTNIPAVRMAEDRSVTAELLRWGLVPGWARSTDGPPLINARAESVATKPSFRDSLRSRRCVIPASGFYEWETVGRTKKPWMFKRRDEEPFGFAGLWDSWHGPDRSALESCAIITTSPNDVMNRIHNRMPVMLTTDQCRVWLSADAEPSQVVQLLEPAPNETMTAVAVSQHVSNVRNEGPDCIAPAETDERGPQLTLGF